jgi:Transglycosylase-like domain
VTAVLGTAGAVGGMAAASDEPDRPHSLRRAPVPIESSLLTASAAAQDRAEQRYSVAVLEHTAAQQAAEKAARDSVWDRIAACETQGDWSMRGPSFSGGVGFSNTPGRASVGTSSLPTPVRRRVSSRSSWPSVCAPASGWARGDAPNDSGSRSFRRRQVEQEALEEETLVRVELEGLAGLSARVDRFHA